MLTFEVTASDGAARRGLLRTPHGVIETPGFFAVATRAALKGLDPESAARAGVEALIVNAYHLHLQPGSAAVARTGGLPRYMGWERPPPRAAAPTSSPTSAATPRRGSGAAAAPRHQTRPCSSRPSGSTRT